MRAGQAATTAGKIAGLYAAIGLAQDPARGIWNRMLPRERQVFLQAAKVSPNLDRTEWDGLSDANRAAIKRAYWRFKAFMERLEKVEGVS